MFSLYLCGVLKEYSIIDILSCSKEKQKLLYYAGTFEETENPELEWPHRHSFYSLVWFTKGNGFYVIDFNEYEIKPQRIFFVNPLQIHNWEYSENSRGYILMIDSVLGTELGNNSYVPFLDISVDEEDLFRLVLETIISEYTCTDLLAEKNIILGIKYLYSLLKRKIVTGNKKIKIPNAQVEKYKELILTSSQLFTVEEYAEQLHTSPEQLNSLCRKWTGSSAKQFSINLKITEVKRLLLFTDLTVSEIAFTLGFEDSSYLSRIFKKKVFLSPSDFVKKYRK